MYSFIYIYLISYLVNRLIDYLDNLFATCQSEVGEIFLFVSK
jgi:hypothetical protein